MEFNCVGKEFRKVSLCADCNLKYFVSIYLLTVTKININLKVSWNEVNALSLSNNHFQHKLYYQQECFSFTWSTTASTLIEHLCLIYRNKYYIVKLFLQPGLEELIFFVFSSTHSESQKKVKHQTILYYISMLNIKIWEERNSFKCNSLST